MKKRLAHYNGALTSTQIAAGMNSAMKNATRLAEDARTMLDHRRYPSAVGLAILAIEESGKLRIMREMALSRNNAEIQSSWREYRQHTSKNQLWLLVDSVLRGASKLREFSHLFDPNSEHPYVLDQIKQISFYTDCLGKAHWSVPQDVIEHELATALVEVAEVLSKSREVTPEEIDLWIHHMQTVFKTTMDAMERGVAAWDAEMRSRGLLSSDGPTMAEFISHGLRSPKKPRNDSRATK